MLMRPHAKMLHCLSLILRAPQQHRILALRLPLRQLIQRQRLAARLQDPRPRRRRKPQRGDLELGHFEQAVVVRHRADDDDRLLLVGGLGRCVLRRGGDAGERDWSPVRAGLEESAEDDLVEGGVGAA